MFKINVMGAVSWMNLAAPFMVSQRRGTLVAIGSVAGDERTSWTAGGIAHPKPRYIRLWSLFATESHSMVSLWLR